MITITINKTRNEERQQEEEPKVAGRRSTYEEKRKRLRIFLGQRTYGLYTVHTAYGI
jgi:hypothetical protein